MKHFAGRQFVIFLTLLVTGKAAHAEGLQSSADWF
jgi:hypothetical protein